MVSALRAALRRHDIMSFEPAREKIIVRGDRTAI